MLKIWGRNNSINVMKVLWVASELGIGFERVDLGGPFGGNHEPGYLKLNPNGLVPTIDDDGFVLWESNSIVRYLAATHSAGGLWPTDPRQRADAERWMDWQLSVLIPSVGPLFLGLIRTPPEKRDAAVLETAREASEEAWRRLEGVLEDGRSYLTGETFTMGDIPAGCFAYRWYSLPIKRPTLPRVEAWYKRLSARPAYREHVMKPLT